MSQRRLRQQPRNNYCELEEPSFDEYVYCDECFDYVYEYCSIHGPLLVIPDEKVPAKSVFPATVPRAALTIPHVFLHIRPSSIPGAGLGVFATLTLPKGVRFGPYCGRRTKDTKSVYCWQIYNADHKPLHLVDGYDEQVANWMRYVNCSRHSLEQNLIAYQYQGEIYYRTIKTIRRSAELLVFYGSEFADLLNVDLGKYNSRKHYLQAIIGTTPETEAQRKTKGHQKLYSEEITFKTIEVSRDIDMQDDTPIENITDNAVDCVIDDNFQYINEDYMITEDKIQDDAIIRAIKQYEGNKLFEHDSETNYSITELEKEVNIANSYKANVNSIEIAKTDFRDQPSTSVNRLKLIAKNEYEFGNAKNVFDSKMILEGKYMHFFTVISVSDKLTWQCKVCHKILLKRTSKKRHALKHSDGRLLKCSECEYETNDKTTLNAHMVKHTGNYINCEICGFQTNSKKNLRKHKLLHAKEQPKCDFCTYKINNKVVMECHRKLHSVKNAMKCKFCDYLCIKKDSLMRHVQVMHKNKQKNDTKILNFNVD